MEAYVLPRVHLILKTKPTDFQNHYKIILIEAQQSNLSMITIMD